MDKELKAMGSILKTLLELDSPTRARVWGWVDDKLRDLPDAPIPQTVAPQEIEWPAGAQ